MKIKLLILVLLCTACSDGLLSSGSSTSSSSCGVGEPPPLPGIPESLPPTQKVSINQFVTVNPNRQLSLPGVQDIKQELWVLKDTDLLMEIDTRCAYARKSANNYKNTYSGINISNSDFIVAARARGANSIRSYSWKVQENMSLSAIRDMANSDPCILQVSDNPTAYTLGRYTPNDPLFGDQDHHELIHSPEAWNSFYATGGATTEVVVAIIDDGCEITHPDLSSQLWVNTDEIAGNSIDDDGNGYVDDVNGYNFSSNIAAPDQQSGKYHGTHVSGLTLADENNSIGLAGVMGRNAKLMCLNVFGTNAGASAANINNAINYARLNGAHVINMSLGGVGTSSTTNTAMQNAAAAGVFLAVAAGNDNTEITSGVFYYPVGYCKDISGCMGVGSVDAITGAKSSFSNYSTTYVEIAAPGSETAAGGVYSTYPTNTYNYLQGTSMASPVLAGAAALAYSMALTAGRTVTAGYIEDSLNSSAAVSSGLSSYVKGGKLLDLQALYSTVNGCN